MANDAIDATNRFLVSGFAGGSDVLIGLAPRLLGRISRAEALNLAAWLVAVADRDDAFEGVLAAVLEG